MLSGPIVCKHWPYLLYESESQSSQATAIAVGTTLPALMEERLRQRRDAHYPPSAR